MAKVIPQVQLLKELHTEICGGNQEFLYVSTPSGAVTWADEGAGHDKPWLATLLRSHIFGEKDLAGTFPPGFRVSVRGDGASLIEADKMTVTDYAQTLSCKDALNATSSRWKMGLLRDSLGLPSITSCSDVSSYCGENSGRGVRVRQYCPVKCGCDDPTSNLFLPRPSAGCPSHCATTEKYRKALSIPCKDEPLPALLNSSVWTNFLAMLPEVIDQGRKGNKAKGMTAVLSSKGCQGIPDVRRSWNYDLCQHEGFGRWQFKSLRLVCPVTCMCTRGQHECPLTCL